MLREHVAFTHELLVHKRHAYEQLYAEAKEEIQALKAENDRLRTRDRKLRVGLARAAALVRHEIGADDAAPFLDLAEGD